MKILILSEFFPANSDDQITGGIEARNFYLAKYLSKDNDVSIFCSRIVSDNYRQQSTDYRLIPLGLPRAYVQSGGLFKRLIYVFSCVFKGLQTDFDIVDGSNFVTHLAAIILGKLKHKPVFLLYADVWIGHWRENLGATGIIGEIIERLILFFGRSANFIATSDFTKNNLIKQGIEDKNITVIPCGVDKEEIKNISSEKQYDLIAVNRLVKYKNTDEIIKAIPANYSILIIGDGSEKKSLEKLITKKEQDINIKLVSGIKNHADLIWQIAKAKIFISASTVEGFNISALEAASLCLPCLLSDIPAHKEHKENLGGVMLFSTGRELSELIIRLMTDAKLYEKLSKLNLENSPKFYWSLVAQKTKDLYRSKLFSDKN